MSLFPAASFEAPLLPKLRGHFAEFLDNASPAGLGILSPPTCVGLRYGRARRHSGFSRRRLLPLRYSPSLRRISGPGHPVPGTGLPRRVPAVLGARGAGISTCYPSATPPGLALGPASPRADQLHPGTLGHSAMGIPTPFSLLIPAFSLPGPPRPLPVALHWAGDAPLPPRRQARPAASAARFSPGHFRRRASRPVSYYALFERVAASEPTSWLSSRPHILPHLTRHSGPWPAVWAVSLSACRLISPGLTPGACLGGIRSLVPIGRL